MPPPHAPAGEQSVPSGWIKVTCIIPPDSLDLWTDTKERIGLNPELHPAIANGVALLYVCADYLAGPS